MTEFDAEAIMARLNFSIAEQTRRRAGFVHACNAVAAGFAGLAQEAWDAEAGSPRAADNAAEPLSVGAVAALIESEAKMDLRALGDALRGYRSLIEQEASIVAAVVTARSIYENCLWTVAMLDSSATSDQRVQRTLTRRLTRLSATARVAQRLNAETSPDGTDPTTARDEILAAAEQRGWPISKGRFGQRVGDRLDVEGLASLVRYPSGAEGYAWTLGSAVGHGEHPEHIASWMNLNLDMAPSWFVATFTPGAVLGPWHLAVAFTEYLGAPVLADEVDQLVRAWRTLSGPIVD